MATGVVVEFDDQKGFGTIRDGDGVDRFFHCTAIADGSRTIEAGMAVDFAVVPGHLGRWEAADVRKRADGGGP